MNIDQVREELKKRDWFKNSEQSIRDRLMLLGKECTGFLTHLHKRPDIGGGVRLIALKDLLIPEGKIFGILVNFLVELPDGEQFAYQYFSWRHGENSGAKGVILVQKYYKGRRVITHVVCLNGFSFAAGSEAYDTPGGFMELSDHSVGDLFNKNQAFRELNEETGLDLHKITRIIELGRLRPDRGMTPNRPNLFAAVIDGSHLDPLKEHNNIDPYEMKSGAVVIPVAGLAEFIDINEDAFFLACVCRLISKGILPIPQRSNKHKSGRVDPYSPWTSLV